MSWEAEAGKLAITGVPDVGTWVVLDGCICRIIRVEDKDAVEVDELFHLREQLVSLDMLERYATEEEIMQERQRRLESVVLGAKSQLEYLQRELSGATGDYKEKLEKAIEITKESIHAYREALHN
ncbi:hypothetical protein [Bacillus sp. NEAU-Y102]